MPQFNAYPAKTNFVSADLFLLFDSLTSSVKTITGGNLVLSVKNLISDNVAVITTASNLTLNTANQYVISNSPGSITITLPDSTSLAPAYVGKKYYISNKGAGALTIQRSGADKINGSNSFSMTQNKAYLFISDGGGTWAVFST